MAPLARVRAAEYAGSGPRRPPRLQVRGECELRLGARGDHSVLSLQYRRDECDRIDGWRPAAFIAAGDPDSVIGQPGIAQLVAHPDGRNTCLYLERCIARRPLQNAFG